MAEKVKNSPGAIGYVEYQDALKNGISQVAVLQNSAGKFVKASMESIAAACNAEKSCGGITSPPRWRMRREPIPFPSPVSAGCTCATSLTDKVRAGAWAISWIGYTPTASGPRRRKRYSALPPQLLTAVRKKAREVQ